MKKILIKSGIFLVIVFLAICFIDIYFVKDQHVFLKHHFFYKQKKNSLDLLIVGDSHAYCGVSSDIIEGKTGLKTYNCGIGGVNFFEIYYNLLEALKYQNPKLVIIETYPFIGVGQEKIFLNKEGLMNRRSTFSLEGKKFGSVKIEEAKVSLPNYNILKVFNTFKYHENWTDLDNVSKVFSKYLTNKTYPPFKDSAKDIDFLSDEIANNYLNKKFNDSIYISEDHKIFIRKIINLSHERKFKLLFVTIPFYERYYSTLKNSFDLAHNHLSDLTSSDINIKMLDINQLVELDNSYFLNGNPSTFNYHNQHLNYKGNIKSSNIIANFINEEYDFVSEQNNSSTVQDALYKFKDNLKPKKIEGELISVNDRSINASNNLIRKSKKFDDPIWSKGATKIISLSVEAPDRSLTANRLVGTGDNDGYVLQASPYIKGVFKWSIWLKGTGTTRLRLQEEGGDYTNYKTLDIVLTSNWEKYTLTCEKENDGHWVRAVLSGIQKNDVINLWNAELSNVSEESKINQDIIIQNDENSINISGWMYLKDEVAEYRDIALRKNKEFTYISLQNQVQVREYDFLIDKYGESYRNSGYIFKIPKLILEKGEYEVFHIVRSKTEKFFIQKLKNKITLL